MLNIALNFKSLLLTKITAIDQLGVNTQIESGKLNTRITSGVVPTEITDNKENISSYYLFNKKNNLGIGNISNTSGAINWSAEGIAYLFLGMLNEKKIRSKILKYLFNAKEASGENDNTDINLARALLKHSGDFLSKSSVEPNESSTLKEIKSEQTLFATKLFNYMSKLINKKNVGTNTEITDSDLINAALLTDLSSSIDLLTDATTLNLAPKITGTDDVSLIIRSALTELLKDKIANDADTRMKLKSHLNEKIENDVDTKSKLTTFLDNAIKTEASTQTELTTVLNNAIKTGTTTQTELNTVLNNAIKTEASTQTELTTVLNNAIKTEASTQTELTTVLNNAIKTEASTQTELTTVLNNAIKTEGSTKTNLENLIKTTRTSTDIRNIVSEMVNGFSLEKKVTLSTPISKIYYSNPTESLSLDVNTPVTASIQSAGLTINGLNVKKGTNNELNEIIAVNTANYDISVINDQIGRGGTLTVTYNNGDPLTVSNFDLTGINSFIESGARLFHSFANNNLKILVTQQKISGSTLESVYVLGKDFSIVILGDGTIFTLKEDRGIRYKIGLTPGYSQLSSPKYILGISSDNTLYTSETQLFPSGFTKGNSIDLGFSQAITGNTDQSFIVNFNDTTNENTEIRRRLTIGEVDRVIVDISKETGLVKKITLNENETPVTYTIRAE